MPKVELNLEDDELMVIYQLPEELRKRLRTNNTIELSGLIKKSVVVTG